MRFLLCCRYQAVCSLVMLTFGLTRSQTATLALPDTSCVAVISVFKEGQGIRVASSTQGLIEGKFRTLRDDSLLLYTASAKLIALPLADLRAVWCRATSVRTGAAVGALAGAIPGAIAGASMAGLANLDCETHCQDLTGLHLLAGAIDGLMRAAVGVAYGAAVGAMIPK